MSFHNWHDFISMNGYAVYVWGAYGSVIIMLAMLGAAMKVKLRQLLKCDTDSDEG